MASVAVCIAGEPRTFDFAAPGIRAHIASLTPFSNTFFSFAVNQLNDTVSAAALSLFQPTEVAYRQVSIQGTLRLLVRQSHHSSKDGSLERDARAFEMAQTLNNCLTMIRRHEERVDMSYKWVMRLRTDVVYSFVWRASKWWQKLDVFKEIAKLVLIFYRFLWTLNTTMVATVTRDNRAVEFSLPLRV